MGKLKKRRRVKGVLIFLSLIGLVCAGIFISNYFQAQAADKPSNHLQNETTNADALAQNTKDLRLEKEMRERQLENAFAWRNKEDIKKAAEARAAETVAAPPAETNPAPPQTQPQGTPVQSQQPAPPQPQSKGRTVYLTFDDGPAAFSGEIIALLEQFHFKATFFMIDGNIRRYPDAVKLMVNSGEAVGLHSVSHRKDIFYASADSVLGELKQNHSTLLEISGVDSFLMRTPYGSSPYMTPEYKTAVKENGYIMWDWNIDSKDWYYRDERFVHNTIEQINRKANHPGPLVILLHERKETLAHLPLLLDYLSQQGFDCKAIDSSVPPVQF